MNDCMNVAFILSILSLFIICLVLILIKYKEMVNTSKELEELFDNMSEPKWR